MSKMKIILLLSYICVASISAAIITPALPQIEQYFQLTHGAVEWVISIFLLGYVMGQLIYGPLANRFGRLNALRSGLLINLLGIVLCLVSVWISNYSLLLLGRLITALGAAAGLSCTFILLNELLSMEQAKRAMSGAIVSFTFGIGLAVTIGGIVTQYLHWQDCFWILFIHGLLMFIFTWQFPETLKQPRPLHPLALLSGYLHALKSAQLIIFSLVIGLCSAVGYCYSAAAPIIAQSILNLSPSQYGYWNLINMAGMLGSGFLSVYLTKYYDGKKILLFSLSMIVPCILSLILFALANQPNAIWFFMTTMLLYLFSGLLFPSASFFASNAIKDKANASSMMSFINMGSAMLSVVIMGYLPTTNIISFILTLAGFYLLVTILSSRYLFFKK